MGMWMATHLAEKLPPATTVLVYDIVPALVDDICTKFPHKVTRGSNPKDVADKAVRPDSLIRARLLGGHI